MKFDYSASITHFWEEAPDQPGYKYVYAAVFCAIIQQIKEGGNRSININFNRVNALLKIPQDTYLDSLKWLNEAGFWQYFPGKNRFREATVYIPVPECIEPGIPGSNGGAMGGATGGSMGGAKEGSNGGATGGATDFSPPHTPPLEVKNILPTNPPVSEPVGGSVGESISHFEKQGRGYSIPTNIDLTEDEQQDLVAAFGKSKLTRALLLVSSFKRKKGGSLATSDFTNVVEWAAQAVDRQDAEAEQWLKEPVGGRQLVHPATLTESGRPPVTGAPKALYALMNS
ncbi:hypothetical protein [Larkinella humicola]|uniref:Uncharacterized protein n=1 Tax=Larkinella humicola TaxID=2607654 RepID=A0A5N1JNS3_9BACT|nr:hypothetical protein [Larkinella humicola]KAA9357266.1 hypothetical protein F0P93_05890 [Larkinella humicola]